MYKLWRIPAGREYKGRAICPFCGTPYIVEKAINYYNTTNQINANVVNIYGENPVDFVIRAGTLKEYHGASTEVVIPNTVTSIGDKAFAECNGLTSVIIPDSITSIGANAFQGCSSLTSLVIPDSVTSIEEGAFSGCSGLTSITISNGVTSIRNHTFFGCENLTSITIPNGVTSIEVAAFSCCTSLTSITIPNGVTSIEDRAFMGCSNLTSIVIPDSVTSILRYAFYGCSSLTNVIIPNSITLIETHAFSGCSSLTSVTIPKGPFSIARDAFENCPKLKIEKKTNSRSGCYIATAVYGSYDCPEVWTLRRFRDNVLAKTSFGRLFIRCYYAVSPTVVRLFGKQRWFSCFWKKQLDKLVERLRVKGFDDSPYSDN